MKLTAGCLCTLQAQDAEITYKWKSGTKHLSSIQHGLYSRPCNLEFIYLLHNTTVKQSAIICIFLEVGAMHEKDWLTKPQSEGGERKGGIHII